MPQQCREEVCRLGIFLFIAHKKKNTKHFNWIQTVLSSLWLLAFRTIANTGTIATRVSPKWEQGLASPNCWQVNRLRCEPDKYIHSYPYSFYSMSWVRRSSSGSRGNGRTWESTLPHTLHRSACLPGEIIFIRGENTHEWIPSDDDTGIGREWVLCGAYSDQLWGDLCFLDYNRLMGREDSRNRFRWFKVIFLGTWATSNGFGWRDGMYLNLECDTSGVSLTDIRYWTNR